MNDSSTLVSQAKAAASALTWVTGASILHLAQWLLLLGYFYFRIPRQRMVYETLNIELSASAKLLITWANSTLTYWYLALPMLFVSVIAVNSAIIALVRSRRWRLAVILLLAIPPLGWLLQYHLTIQAPLDRLAQELR